MNDFVLFVLLLLTITVVSINGDWVDPDTPQQYRQTKALTKGDHREFKLVRACFPKDCAFLLFSIMFSFTYSHA
jgi:hypothetical protein